MDYISSRRRRKVVVAMLSTLVFGQKSAVASFAHRSTHRGFHASVVCQLNRFLFDPAEVDDCETIPTVVLAKDDYRTIHAAKILGLHTGDTVRAGVVGQHSGLLTDDAVVQWIPEGKVKKTEPLGNGKPPGSLRVRLDSLIPASDQTSGSKDNVSLLLALPRPLQLGRVLPMIAQMGVDQLILTGARKVPKDYFGSHLFRKPQLLRERLIEGLSQSGDLRLPTIHIAKNLRDFLSRDLDTLFPSRDYARVIAHPQRVASSDNPIRMKDVVFPDDKSKRILVAVGPEGGWEEPDELDRFQELGFQKVSMGKRVLRSDVAVVSLLSLANDVVSDSQ